MKNFSILGEEKVKNSSHFLPSVGTLSGGSVVSGSSRVVEVPSDVGSGSSICSPSRSRSEVSGEGDMAACQVLLYHHHRSWSQIPDLLGGDVLQVG